MRRIWIVCVLVLSITAAAAVADKGANNSHWRNAPARNGDGQAKARAKTSVLFGDRHIEAQADSNRSGRAESFPFANRTTGTARTLHVYIAEHNRARSLIAGLYSNKKGRPGSLIASGSVRAKKGKWNTITLRFRSSRRGSHIVRAGRIYWVALLGKGGSLAFRDRTTNMCRSATSAPAVAEAAPAFVEDRSNVDQLSRVGVRGRHRVIAVRRLAGAAAEALSHRTGDRLGGRLWRLWRRHDSIWFRPMPADARCRSGSELLLGDAHRSSGLNGLHRSADRSESGGSGLHRA